MFDIKKLAINDAADYQVTDAKGDLQYFDHPTDVDDKGNPVQVPVTISVISPGTKKAAQAIFKRDESRSARVLGAMGGKTSKRTEMDELKERAAFLASVTISLNGFDFDGGAQGLYMDLTLGHIADGVEKFFNDRGNFIADSVSAASSTSASQPG